ncbi:hypothetical protein JHK87_000939 [Glycine soja]|nr:hypothetical protein JHK87_000939 [Glycine soja]
MRHRMKQKRPIRIVRTIRNALVLLLKSVSKEVLLKGMVGYEPVPSASSLDSVSTSLVYGLHRGVFDLDIDEEEVLKLATLGNGANSKDTIDTLKRSLVMRNRSYKELMANCTILGRGKARYSKKLEKVKEKITKLKQRHNRHEKRSKECFGANGCKESNVTVDTKQENLPERDDGSEKGGFATRAQPGWLCKTLRGGLRTIEVKRVAL